MIITYISSDEEKKLVFEVVGSSIGWGKLLKELPRKYNEISTDGPIEL